jgi:hypothetical protein
MELSSFVQRNAFRSTDRISALLNFHHRQSVVLHREPRCRNGPRRTHVISQQSSPLACRQRWAYRHTIVRMKTTTEGGGVYQDPTLSWASNNRLVAERCLVQPPLKTATVVPTTTTASSELLHHNTKQEKNNSSNNNNDKPYQYDTDITKVPTYPSLESYCAARQWIFPVSHEDDQEQKALALVSHILSAPLTLAHLHTMTQQQQQKQRAAQPSSDNDVSTVTAETVTPRSFRWCCLGARAEATIPINFWREFLYMATTSTSRSTLPIHVQLDFVGPDVLMNPSPKSKGRPMVQSLSWNGSTMDLKWRYKGFFHTMMMEHDAIMKNMKKETSNTDLESSCDYDAVILYNSGLGHANQFENWKPTIEYLLRLQQQQLPLDQAGSPKSSHHQQQGLGQRRRPTIWLTAHSHLDAQRDAQILQEYYKVDHVTYQRNPFASRVTYQDPLLEPTTLQKNNSDDDDDDDDDENDGGGYVDGLSLIRPNEYFAVIP